MIYFACRNHKKSYFWSFKLLQNPLRMSTLTFSFYDCPHTMKSLKQWRVFAYIHHQQEQNHRNFNIRECLRCIVCYSVYPHLSFARGTWWQWSRFIASRLSLWQIDLLLPPRHRRIWPNICTNSLAAFNTHLAKVLITLKMLFSRMPLPILFKLMANKTVKYLRLFLMPSSSCWNTGM